PRAAREAPPPAVEVETLSETRPSMSTVVTITVAGVDPDVAAPAVDAAFAVFDRVDQVMNEWRPGSPLSALNAAAGTGRPVPLPGDLCDVLRAGKAGAERTGGLFDPTWAALRGVWRFGDGEASRVPTDAEVKGACALVSWSDLVLEPEAATPGTPCQASLRRSGMAVGLGGLAKGWGVDRAVLELRRRGLRDFTVQAGGDLFASGTRGGRPWRIGVRDPRGAPGEPFAWMEVQDAAFSTTGDSERFFVRDGVRYHHVIDTRTCRPATASRQASVLAPSALEAEVLGKAVFVLGGEEGVALAARNGASVVLVTAGNAVVASPALSGRLHVVRPPGP
ncbi:MAG: FAD:protein FMN transferase, partial [Anaeromyxobacteraceae bacterium]